ncbi:UDP-N-acetylmuramoyl-tripeptide--D-alanyl-D-alanine ligase [Chryseobacterium sp. A321]
MNVQEFYSLFKQCEKVTIDSRTVEKGDLFFAFSGENYDAGKEAANAIKKGALGVIVERKQYEDAENQVFYANSTLQFLQDLALYHREQLSIPIIGLTGSNGKTTSKELLSSVLQMKFNVQYTKGNLNNHIGVPLTLLSIRDEHEIAVVEMGANHKREIEFLCTLSKPTIGYITNFGKAHLEGFGGFEGVIEGKSELYTYIKENGGLLVINTDDSIQVEKSNGYTSLLRFGSQEKEYRFEKVVQDHFIGLKYKQMQFLSKLTGDYNFSNLSAAVTLGLYFGIKFEQISTAIESYEPSNMRSQVVKKEDRTLVLDTYNANPSSMKVALENFKSFEGSKAIIIGDMLELGRESEKEHKEILEFVKSLSFQQVLTVGREFSKVNPNGFLSTSELATWLESNPIKADAILLKGSRGVALEKLIPLL